MIRVLIVDDHAIVREGLTRLINSTGDIEVAGTASEGNAAVDAVVQLAPDVVLMDLSMPVLDGIEATRRIMAHAPGTQIVVLTSFSDQRRIVDALQAGACGYLLKDAEPDELLRGIRAAAAGESPLDPKAARVMLDTQRTARGDDAMSAREREVLTLVAQGLANKQIARRLGISDRTVKAHLTRVFRAIGVSDRTQAALWAREHLSPAGATTVV
jgi:DNA-binding NarL/FixJ family response regulator